MHIGITGPIDLLPLKHRLGNSPLPQTYSFPLVGKLAEELIVRGNEVSVFAGSTDVSETLVVRGDKVTAFICPLRKRRAAYDFYKLERMHLSTAMKNSGCDLIHAHWTYEYAAAALESGLPNIVTAHDSPLAILRYFIASRNFPFWTAKAILGARVIRRARMLTTVSPYCKHDITFSMHPKAAIMVIPNGVAANLIEAGKKRLCGAPLITPFTIATILQGFQGRKNPKPAIKSFALIRSKFPDARLLMFGTDFEEGGPADRWSQGKGLATGIHFIGKLSHNELMRHMANHVHLLIHPAKEESFGMAALEAMSLGIPVIGGKMSGGVPYVLDGGSAGILVDITSPAIIADAACDLLGNPERSRGFSQAGWNRANTEFSFDRMVSLYEEEYAKSLAFSHDS